MVGVIPFTGKRLQVFVMKSGIYKNTEHTISLFSTHIFIVRTLRARGLNTKFSLSPAAQAKGSWIQSPESRLLP